MLSPRPSGGIEIARSSDTTDGLERLEARLSGCSSVAVKGGVSGWVTCRRSLLMEIARHDAGIKRKLEWLMRPEMEYIGSKSTTLNDG
ncbi:uncharacterized protein N7459_004410 [Penicillium hispanicum]|uniref:uncharacterized protein n=1 Tax=Penicillium hispanicum TaxID=1080232 RepID=UPI0025426428|nr:uncharacterized protein N7459_004410 [Penicillium hispanicum]KAJ5584610.1 hypothetical protein N7459_004410 [Penicillium hispanicum]